MGRRPPPWLLPSILIAAGACGGIAIIDPPSGEGGSGAQGGSGGTGIGGTGIGGTGLGAGGSTTSGPACGTPPPVGQAIGCSGAVTAGSGMGPSCAAFVCDDASNTWTSECNDQGCSCLYNNMEVCNCGGGSAFCGDTCCPPPFQ